jgi:hypothetical protein
MRGLTFPSLVFFTACAVHQDLGSNGGPHPGPDASIDADDADRAEASSADHSEAGRTGDADNTCTPTPVAQLCVRGVQIANGEQLVADAPVKVMLVPKGCHSSACTFQDQASCQATLQGPSLTVEGSFCLRSDGMCSLPDCGGGGTVSCDSGVNLAAGSYTAKLGTLSVPFTIPSTVPFGGKCDGDPFAP